MPEILKSSEESEGKKEDRNILIARLTAKDTSIEERITLTKELFPEERKREILANADVDSKGRPVRYFRDMVIEELEAILNHKESSPLENPLAGEQFLKKSIEIKRDLKYFLNKEGIYDQFKDDFEKLASDFTLDNYKKFVQRKLPRIKLFKLHIGSEGGGGYIDITGLKSLSVGSPSQPPSRSDNKKESPVIEFSIPSDEVYVHPLFKTMNIEMEKEVNTLDLKPEWIVDVYNGTQDFAERFIKDPKSVLYSEYQKKEEARHVIIGYISENAIWDILQSWKHTESIADLIPVKKLEDIDENNPNLQIPLVSEKS